MFVAHTLVALLSVVTLFYDVSWFFYRRKWREEEWVQWKTVALQELLGVSEKGDFNFFNFFDFDSFFFFFFYFN